MTNTITTVTVQEMEVEQDTLIITDPCYIMADEHWEHWLDMAYGENPLSLDDYLRKYLNFGEVIAHDTMLGDWSNKVFNSVTGEVLGEFAADAGMVIVCTASDLANYGGALNNDKIKDYAERGLLAIIPDFTGHVQLNVESIDRGGYTESLAVIYGQSQDEDESLYFETMSLKQD